MLNVDEMPGVPLAGMRREEWIARRRNSIGGSDIGAIMGFNKYRTPLRVYQEKAGIAPMTDVSDKDAVYWGTVLEPVVADEFTKRTEKRVEKVEKILIHPKHEFMTANIDRSIVGENAGLECKTASAYGKDDWEDEEIPASYILQCQWYIYITGAKVWYIACLLGGQKFIWKTIQRDDELISIMESAAIDFWDHVLKRIPPLAASGDVKAFEANSKETISLPDNADDLLGALIEVKDQAKVIEDKKKELEARVKQMLDGHMTGLRPLYKVTWSQSSVESFDAASFKVANPEIAKQYLKISQRDNGVRVKRLKAV